MKKYLLVFLLVILSACQTVEITLTPALTRSTSVPTKTFATTPSLAPTKTRTPKPSLSLLPKFEVCSPLEEETFQSLPLILANPLKIPSDFGMDTGHHGVDFAYYQRGERSSIEGIEIYAILEGKVIFSLDDDIPYGYTILIETPLEDLPNSLQEQLLLGYQPVPDDPHYRLYCPEVPPPALTGEYSVYHLYAHMQNKPQNKNGDHITCGQSLGTVGSTGYSSSPHLHLETRLGPSKADFRTMAHYENTNTAEQMRNYCLWRMSGYYQLFDPFFLFESINNINP